MMKLKKGSYKRDESEVGNGCNVYVKEMEGRLERDVMYMQKKWMGGWKGASGWVKALQKSYIVLVNHSIGC